MALHRSPAFRRAPISTPAAAASAIDRRFLVLNIDQLVALADDLRAGGRRAGLS